MVWIMIINAQNILHIYYMCFLKKKDMGKIYIFVHAEIGTKSNFHINNNQN